MRFGSLSVLIAALVLATACERSPEQPTPPAKVGQPPTVTVDAPGLNAPAIPENLSEPPQQKGKPDESDANKPRSKKNPRLIYTAPAEWTKIPPCTGVAERYALKHADGDHEDAILDIERPAKTAAGVAPLVDRWRSTFSGPDGAALPDGAFRTETLDLSGMNVTLVEIRGYHKALGPAPARPGVQLLGAVIDAPGGLWAFKLLGPEQTVAQHREPFLEFIRALRLE